MAGTLLTKPLLPLRGLVILPGMLVNVDVGRDKSMAAVKAALDEDKRILLAAQKDAARADINVSDLYNWGVLAEIKQQLTLPSGAMRLLVEGLERVRLTDVTEVSRDNEDYFVGQGEIAPSVAGDAAEAEALRRLLLEAFENWVLLTKKINAEVVQAFKAQPDTGRVADMITGYLPVSLQEKERVLETAAVNERLRYLYELLTREQEIADVAKSISQQVHAQVEQNQKEYYLREQIKAISKELGEAEDVQSEIAEYRKRVAELALPQDVAAKLDKEFNRLIKMPPMTPDGAVIRSYIDALLSLPWGKFTEDNFDLQRAQKILDSDHYGLKKVKERIMEYLAVRALAPASRGPILCLVGPPGVGKTSLAYSVARAIDRKFTRVSLGGIRDEAEIRGHRRTYIGSMPGRIIHGMQTAGCMNPVFLLDEVDKMAADFRGDPASALLEVLDPEQNNAFSDHFIEFPFDLSHVFWIVTANTVETIPPALLDRMEIIQLSSYTDEEKVKIAQLHLLPKEIKLNGLDKYKVAVSEKAIRRVIHDYTREAGVRNLERKLAAVCRKIAYRIVKGKGQAAQVTEKNLEKYLGKVLFMDDDISLESSVGVCNGLAWTSVGGELLKVEVLAFKGKGNLTLTGQLGDVMKESAQAGYTYIRSRAKTLGLPDTFGENTDLHIHLPEGAVPKDGPSAGVTMVTAMVSALTGKPVKGKLAMTGEITLSGKVWPVGGIKEKMLAAYRYGVKTVLLPKRNMQDLDELPDNVRKEMQFIPVEHLDDVLQIALEE
ncbi:MAG: endopeptidase La [Phascolarctobacterium sp.]|uniref:endopeptidase La n=1 Tax=Phascolarctobacterium sp. TaxID=2049039 RepID=UPI0026DAC5DF|nr:endopeptidase La [Phascolarctobacterium sp.]MDO4920461.1 endopeptidase La [Phascolarctobacterium sp.]